MSELETLQAAELRHEQRVIIDQYQSMLGNDHVAVLQVTMGNTSPLQLTGERGELPSQRFHLLLILEVFAQVNVDRVTVYPVHLQYRIPAVSHANAFLDI